MGTNAPNRSILNSQPAAWLLGGRDIMFRPRSETVSDKETYLGDGLYASCDGCQICLRAPRDGIDHFVYLEPAVLVAFERYVAAVKIRRGARIPRVYNWA